MIFGVLNTEKIRHQHLVRLPTSPVYCSHFSLGNPKKSFFKEQEYYSYILQIIYVISEENKLLPPYPPRLKNLTALPCIKAKLFDLTEGSVAFLQTLVAVRKTGCDEWQLECQASNVIVSVQGDHLLQGYMLPVFFAADQLHSQPRSAEIQPMLQQERGGTQHYLQSDEKVLNFTR